MLLDLDHKKLCTLSQHHLIEVKFDISNCRYTTIHNTELQFGSSSILGNMTSKSTALRKSGRVIKFTYLSTEHVFFK